MPPLYKKLRIFLASPSDVAAHRAKLETVIESFEPLADHLGLKVETIDWHDCTPGAGRPQQIIFDQYDPSTWDILIVILWHRFGTPSAANDPITNAPYISGTEEEFRKAYELYRRTGRPQIMTYRCTGNPPLKELDPDQLKKVNNFFKEIEDPGGKFPVLVRDFDTAESFEKMAIDHLQKMLIGYSEQLKKPITAEVAQALIPSVPNNLPRRSAFFGRTKEIADIMRALLPTDRTWGILLDGIGGIGKTALAIETAYLAQEAGLFEAFVFVSAKINRLDPGGIRPLDASAHTLADFLNETARILGQSGITRLTAEDKRKALLDELKMRKTLLIYDNLETLTKEEQEAMADFLRELPANCKAIITSRRRGGEGAIWLRVETLDPEAARGILENEMAKDASLERKLLPVRARWQELLDEINGSPLALVHTLGLMRVRATLGFDEALKMLKGSGQTNDLTTFIYQEAARELTVNDRIALGALSFFIPTGSFQVWSEVAGLTRNALQATIDRLSALSLLDIPPGEERYGLHPLTRSFIRQDILADRRKAYQQGMQFARYWQGYAKQYGGNTAVSYRNTAKLEIEWSNLQAAINWLWETARLENNTIQDKEAAVLYNEIVGSIARGFLYQSGRWDEMMQSVSRSYQVAELNKNTSETADRAFEMTWLYFNLGNYAEADRWADLCLEIIPADPDSYSYGRSLSMKGTIARLLKNYEECESFLKKALAIHQHRKDNIGLAVELKNVGDLAFDRDDLATAEKYYMDSLALYEKIDFKSGHSITLLGLGSLAYKRNQYPEARNYYEKALPIAREVGRRDAIAGNLFNLSITFEQEKNPAQALPFAQEALKIYQQLKHPRCEKTQNLVTRLQSTLAKISS